MKLPFAVYIIDTETTGLQKECEIIELSIYRLNDDRQETWCIKPNNHEAIQADALRINGHKLEDLKWQTAYGRETYKEAGKVLPLIENFFMDDNEAAEGRILVGQNIKFDLDFLQDLWRKEGAIEIFPFGDRPKCIDTMQLELALDLVRGERSQYYNLRSLVEKHGVKRERAHTASGDTKMTKDVLLKQLDIIKKTM